MHNDEHLLQLGCNRIQQSKTVDHIQTLLCKDLRLVGWVLFYSSLGLFLPANVHELKVQNINTEQ